jgi:ribosomal protein L40E
MWIRTCQECGHKQPSKPPREYKGDSWQDTKCRKCGSMGLDYGRADVDPAHLGQDDE